MRFETCSINNNFIKSFFCELKCTFFIVLKRLKYNAVIKTISAI